MSVNPDVLVGNVGVFGIGGTKTREAVNLPSGDIASDLVVPTPYNREDFFKNMANTTLRFADEQGCVDIFAGFPGPVRRTKTHAIVGPMVNIDWLKDETIVLEEELAKADPILGRALDNGDISLMAGNDGLLAAGQGVHFLNLEKDLVSGLIVGTGVGGDTLERVEGATFGRTGSDNTWNLYAPLPGRREWGHMPASEDIEDTFERRYAGPALRERFGVGTEDAPADHKLWQYAGRGIANLVGIVSLNDTPDIVVVTGGVGANNFDTLKPHIDERLDELRASSVTNLVEALKVTREITSVPTDSASTDVAELYGAAVLIASHKYAQAA